MDTLKDFLVSLQSSKDAGGIGGTVDPLLQFHLIADFMYEFAFQWDDRADEDNPWAKGYQIYQNPFCSNVHS